MPTKLFLITSLFLIFGSYACKKKGCTNPNALNYSPSAEKDNGTCKFSVANQTIEYGPEDIQNLELYLPTDHDENTKVIVMVHGGGWVVGYNTDAVVTTFDGRYGWDILNPLLDEGYACAVMKYRTACYHADPETTTGNTTLYLDQMMEDLDLAIGYLKNNAATLGIADNHFQLLGESAGGHIVLSYAVRNASDPALISATSMFGPTALDDSEWKLGLHELDSLYPEGILVDDINYFRTKENDCALETNKHLSVLTELRSFGDHDTVMVHNANPYLQEISPATLSNIEKQTPIFIMHGNTDALVPDSQAELMFDAYSTAFPTAVIANEGVYTGDLKKTIYSNCGHGWIGGGCQKTKIMSDIVKWMNAH